MLDGVFQKVAGWWRYQSRQRTVGGVRTGYLPYAGTTFWTASCWM